MSAILDIEEKVNKFEIVDHEKMKNRIFPMVDHPLYGNVQRFEESEFLLPAKLADFTNETDFGGDSTNLEICPACFFNTSGTSSRSKKIPFSDADLARQKTHEAIALTKLNMGKGDSVMSLGAPLPSISGWAIVNGSEATGAVALNTSQVDYDDIFEYKQQHLVTYVIGTPLVVKEIGLAIEQEYGPLRKVFPNLKTAVIFGDILPDNMRKFIKDLWGFQNVYSLYGTVEADVVGTEDPAQPGKIQLMRERLYLEFIPESEIVKEIADPDYRAKSIPVDQAKNLEIGEIVISDFSRETLPLVRYRIGDVVQIHQASDGDAVSVTILGRSKNAIPVGSTFIHEFQIDRLLSQIFKAGLIEWKLVQREEKRQEYDLYIQIAAGSDMTPAQRFEIQSGLKKLVDADASFDIEKIFVSQQVYAFEKINISGDAKARRITLL